MFSSEYNKNFEECNCCFMKQKSRAVLMISWLVLRLRWSLIFAQQSLVAGGIQRGWAKPGIIHFARQPRQLPLERWSFDESRGAYLYSHPAAESLHVCFLPEISRN